MASIVPRRSSYQLETERRSSVRAVSTADRCVGEGKVDQASYDEQQQPSPHVRKTSKLDDSDADNNQEEESSCLNVSEESIRPASPVLYAPKEEKKLHEFQHLRKQAATNREPPLTTAQLRQENAALKLQLTQLGNQHEAAIQGLTRQLTEATLVHSQVEQNLKKQIDELEKRQFEAVEKAQKYQVQVESLQKMFHQLESQAKGGVPAPRTPLKAPQLLSAPPKETAWVPATMPRRSESPLPRQGNLAQNVSIQPFAWRTEGSSAIHGSSAAPKHTPGTVVGRPSFVPTSESTYHTLVAPPRCIPVPIHDFSNAVPTHSSQYILPPPLSATKEQQQRQDSLTKKLSGGNLLSYCADMITSKLAAHTPVASTPKPNMKVMPFWDPQDDIAFKNTSTSSGITIPVPDARALADEYATITIL